MEAVAVGFLIAQLLVFSQMMGKNTEMCTEGGR